MYPILVAEYNKKIIGWGSINPYRKGRDAFKRTAEIDCYIHEAYRRHNIGTEILHQLLKTANELGYTTVFAIVLDKNTPSRRLLEKNRFEQWGFLPEIGEIDGTILGHVYYGKKL